MMHCFLYWAQFINASEHATPFEWLCIWNSIDFHKTASEQTQISEISNINSSTTSDPTRFSVISNVNCLRRPASLLKNIHLTLHILSLTPAFLFWLGICEGQFHIGIGFFFSEISWTFSFLNPRLFFLLHKTSIHARVNLWLTYYL